MFINTCKWVFSPEKNDYFCHDNFLSRALPIPIAVGGGSVRFLLLLHIIFISLSIQLIMSIV